MQTWAAQISFERVGQVQGRFRSEDTPRIRPECDRRPLEGRVVLVTGAG